MEEDVIDLQDYLEILIRWWWLLVAVPLIAVLGAIAFSLSRPTTYESSATLMVDGNMTGTYGCTPGFRRLC